MIVCSCNSLTEEDVTTVVTALHTAEPDRFITPGAVYRELGCMPNCGGCFPLIAALIRMRRQEMDQAANHEDTPA